MAASRAPPTGHLACNPGMCPRPGIEPATLWFSIYTSQGSTLALLMLIFWEEADLCFVPYLATFLAYKQLIPVRTYPSSENQRSPDITKCLVGGQNHPGKNHCCRMSRAQPLKFQKRSILKASVII